MKKDLLRSAAVAALTVGIPLFALAQQAVPPPPAPPATSISGLIGVMCVIINYLFAILIVLAIFFVLIAAFRYLTAGGDPEKVKGANHTLIFAAVAVAVAILAKGFPAIVGGIVGTGSTGLINCT